MDDFNLPPEIDRLVVPITVAMKTADIATSLETLKVVLQHAYILGVSNGVDRAQAYIETAKAIREAKACG